MEAQKTEKQSKWKDFQLTHEEKIDLSDFVKAGSENEFPLREIQAELFHFVNSLLWLRLQRLGQQ